MLNNYFGSSGGGKSITLIGTSKHRNDFHNFGSLHVNSKTLKRPSEEQNYLTVKQISPMKFHTYFLMISINIIA